MSSRNREEAGRCLAERLLHLKGADPVMLALPRGGVPVDRHLLGLYRAWDRARDRAGDGKEAGRMSGQAEERDPLHHTRKMQARLRETVEHLRADIGKVEEPRLKAMFETSAEVLEGLIKAFQDYERKNEPAWRG